MFPFQKIDTLIISWQAFDFFMVLVLGTSIAVAAVINVSASLFCPSSPVARAWSPWTGGEIPIDTLVTGLGISSVANS